MVSWADVERVALALPQASLGEAHSGEPAVLVRNRIFARSRERGTVLQFWVADEQLVDGYVESDPATFRSARGYSRTVVMARLGGLDETDLRDVLAQSWRHRAPARLRTAHADIPLAGSSDLPATLPRPVERLRQGLANRANPC